MSVFDLRATVKFNNLFTEPDSSKGAGLSTLKVVGCGAEKSAPYTFLEP